MQEAKAKISGSSWPEAARYQVPGLIFFQVIEPRIASLSFLGLNTCQYKS
jgi:hypothetical protein